MSTRIKKRSKVWGDRDFNRGITLEKSNDDLNTIYLSNFVQSNFI